MTTVGEILRSAREQKKLTIEQVEKATKIRAKFISALENNQFDKLPEGTFARGFVKNYASFLGLSPTETLAFYRRQANVEKLPSIPEQARPLRDGFVLTPSLLSSLAISLLLIVFFVYLAFSYFQYAGAPALTVSAPANNIVVSQDNVKVIGKTDPGASLTINDQHVGTNEGGNFEVVIPLHPGLNTLTIVSSNKFQRKTIVVRNLRLER